MPNRVLHAEHLGLSYGAKSIFNGLSLEVQCDEIVALIGPSGAGKSSFLRCLAGLQKPSHGTIYFENQPITGPQPELAVAFQEATLLPWLSVYENVGFGLQFKHQARLSPAEQKHRISKALKQVGLYDQAHYSTQQLSGGMAQRVALARCIARQPNVLLLDEPFGALDAVTRKDMQQLLLQLQQSLACSVVLVTHDIEEAIVLADRIVMISPRAQSPLPAWLISPAAKQIHSPAYNELQQQLHQALAFTFTESNPCQAQPHNNYAVIS